LLQHGCGKRLPRRREGRKGEIVAVKYYARDYDNKMIEDYRRAGVCDGGCTGRSSCRIEKLRAGTTSAATRRKKGKETQRGPLGGKGRCDPSLSLPGRSGSSSLAGSPAVQAPMTQRQNITKKKHICGPWKEKEKPNSCAGNRNHRMNERTRGLLSGHTDHHPDKGVQHKRTVRSSPRAQEIATFAR